MGIIRWGAVGAGKVAGIGGLGGIGEGGIGVRTSDIIIDTPLDSVMSTLIPRVETVGDVGGGVGVRFDAG